MFLIYPCEYCEIYDMIISTFYNIFLEKIMQKALMPVNSSENGCFADDAVEEAEETDTPLG